MIFTYANKDFDELNMARSVVEKLVDETECDEETLRTLIIEQIDREPGHVTKVLPALDDNKKRMVAWEVVSLITPKGKINFGLALVLDYQTKGKLWVEGIKRLR